MSDRTTELFVKFGIKVTRSFTGFQESIAEKRFHRNIKHPLKVLSLDTRTSWEYHLPAELLALRTITHESAGVFISELRVKYLRTPKGLIYEK